MTSLGNRIISGFLTCSTGVLLGVTAAAFAFAQHDEEIRCDLELRSLALSADSVLAPDQAASASLAVHALTLQEWSAQGQRCVGEDCHLVRPERSGFAVITAEDGRHVRVYALTSAARTLQASQPLRARWLHAAIAAVTMAAPFALAIPLIAALLHWITWRAFAPARRLAREIDTRGEALMPVQVDALPRELAGLVQSFMGWLERIAIDRDRQRRFTRDAAGLLAPLLATARTQADAAASGTQVPARAAEHASLARTLGRAARLVEQSRVLITTVEDRVLPAAAPRVRLDDIARAEVMAQAPAAHARRIAVSLDAHAPVELEADGKALREVLRHLLDNAIRYTPAPGRVRVAVERQAEDALLTVEDTGTGIGELERPRVFEPFYRAPGTIGSGSGLGLSIARHIVLQHRGTITLRSSAQGGLRVDVALPPHRRARRRR